MVLHDADGGVLRAVNAAQVQTFIPNPFGTGTLITFASGDTVTVKDDFDSVLATFMGDSVDG